MVNISKEDVLRTADVARIALSDEEAQTYSTQLTAMLNDVEKINEINTDGVALTTNGNDVKNVVRLDEPKKWNNHDAIMKNAPDHEDGQFKVPTIIE